MRELQARFLNGMLNLARGDLVVSPPMLCGGHGALQWYVAALLDEALF